MAYVKLPLKPGVYKDDSSLEAKGYWVDTDKVRFVRGLPETIYGWERATTSLMKGICRGAITYADNARNPWAAFGTHLQLYNMDISGNLTDMTPRLAYGQLTNPFTTTNGTATTVTFNTHGLVVGQLFTVLTQSATVGGITLSGAYPVVSVTDANNFVITTATATAAGPGGGTVNYATGIVPGQSDGLIGLGYGTGGYGSGTYGSASTGYTLYPRTWSFAQWGQNLISNPRGGGIYEWAPNSSATELISDTTFATGWTLNAGWAQAAGVATASVSVTGLTTSILCQPGAWHLLMYDATRSAGSVQASMGGTNIGSAVSAAGHQAVPFYSGAGGSQTLALTGTGFTGTIANPTAKVLTIANIITNAPTTATCIFTTSERILVACGTPNSSANFDAMRVAWTDTQNNQTWTAAGTNLAGSFFLTNGSRIVRGLPGSAQNLIWTDTALYGMRFNPDPSIVYQFPEIASGCGLIGPNAVALVAGVAYWMDSAGGFWMFDGSYPQPLKCTLARDVHDNLAFVQQDKIYAFPVMTNGYLEIWWLYPDMRDGSECSRYVSYAITESNNTGLPVWFNGTFDRTAWAPGGLFQFPLAVDAASGQIWFQEKSFSADGGARSWSATTAYFDLSDDGTQMRFRNIQPDPQGLQGGYTITINTKIRNGGGILSNSVGPYSANNMTGKINVRASGEEAQLAFAGNSSPAFWRLGAYRHEIEQMGRVR